MNINDRLDKIAKAVPYHSVYLMDIESIRSKFVMMQDQINRLTAEVERLRVGGCARDQQTTQFCAEAVTLADEVKRLRMRLDLTECHLKDANERLKEKG